MALDKEIEMAAHIEDSSVESLDRDHAEMTCRILLKNDLRILPALFLLFLCSYLDRSNVGNANIIGFKQDTGISSNQYNQGLSVLYATYIASELPSNLILKKVSPNIWLPTLACAWGLLTVCVGFVRNFASFVAIRALQGFMEGGLLPGMVLYLSMMYSRGDMALRMGLIYTAAPLSGAIGGLLARGLSAIGDRDGQYSWSWIFIIEGLITITVGILAWTFLPKSLETARYLTVEERRFATMRITGATAPGNPERFKSEEHFSWSEVRRGVFNLPVLFTGTAFFSLLAGIYSFGLFLPTIINDLGIISNANQSQLWTVIPYALATPVTVLTTFLSDRMKLRGLIILCVLPVAIAGYATIVSVDAPRVRFGMTCLMALGLYPSVPCILVWNSNNSAGHYKRATTSALQLAIANAGGFVATTSYPTSDGPLYHRGHAIMLGLLIFSWFMVLANVLWCMKINRDKKKGKYEQYEGCGDDRDPLFKLIL